MGWKNCGVCSPTAIWAIDARKVLKTAVSGFLLLKKKEKRMIEGAQLFFANFHS
jgi:hypothetical protein